MRRRSAKTFWALSGLLLITSARVSQADITPQQAIAVARAYAGKPQLFCMVSEEKGGPILVRRRQFYEVRGGGRDLPCRKIY